MRIIVLSDTHGEETTVRWLLEQAWKTLGPVDAYLHCGDGAGDFARLENFIRARDEHTLLYGVRGNCDFAAGHPDRLVVPFGGLKIYMTHGHIHRVKSGLDDLQSAALEAGADIALYGHTHRADVEYSTPWLVNPGAVENDCCALLEVEGAKPHVKLINLGFH